MNTQSQNAHTPGPWQIEGDVTGPFLSAYLSTIHPSPLFEVIPLTGTHQEVVANMTLLSSAPELLELLQSVVAEHDDRQSVSLASIGHARTLIAKATGGAA